MSAYTPNYGLHQWVPEDKFLRTDFNEDFSKIDAELKAAADKAARALGGLEAADYNIYNLILQNDYDGKYSGYKKALLYDGFLDQNGIQSASQGFLWSKGRYTLSTQGESDRDAGFSTSRGSLEMDTKTFTARGNGSWTGFTCKLYNMSSSTLSSKVEYSVTVNGTTALTGVGNSVGVGSRSDEEYTITFSQPVTLANGDTYQLHLKSGNVNLIFYYDSTGSVLGGIFHIQPLTAASGTLTTASRDLPTCGGLLAWVRHTAGTSVTLSLNAVGGEAQPFTMEESRTTQNLQMVSCMESTFRLAAAQMEGDYQFSLELSLGTMSSGQVYDYGIVLLP